MVRKVRLILKTEDVHRSFWWFEMKGEDFYFGPSHKVKTYSSVASTGAREMTLTVPPNKEDFAPETLKASFHESGQFHLKTFEPTDSGSRMMDKKRWVRKPEIAKPLRFLTILSKVASLYPVHKGSLTRGRTPVIGLGLTQDQSFCRLYLEFYLSPAGTHEFPPALWSGVTLPPDQPLTHSMSTDLILAMRYAVIAPSSPITSWHPDTEIDCYGIDTPVPS